MIRPLLLAFLLLIGSITHSLAQTEQEIMGQATNFAVLASSKIVVNSVSGVTGSVGIENGANIENPELLSIQEGSIQTGGAALGAQASALAAYNRFDEKAGSTTITNLNSGATGIRPGHYKLTGTASFESVLTLNAEGNPEGLYVFEINGDLISNAPNAAIRLIYAQSKNVYWIVSGRVNLGGITNFVGTIIAKGDVYLQDGVGVNGRAISLDGTVTLERNNLYLPGIVRTDVKVVKSAPDKAYRIGDEVTYTIAVSNSGPGTAYDVVMQDKLPVSGLQYVAGSATFSKGTFDPATMKWTIPSLEFAETSEIKLTFKITAAGSLTNTATVTSRDPDPQEDDNTSSWTIIVPETNADLSITKTAATAPYSAGGEVTYTLTVTNNGPYDAKAVVVTDVLPAGLDFISATGGYVQSSGTFNLGDMAAGTSKTVTITARINKNGTIVNTATVAGSTEVPDLNPDNNSATAVIEVACPEITGFALAGEATLCQGISNIIYTATPIAGASYTFTVTGGLQIVSQSDNKVTILAGATNGTISVTAKDLCNGTYTASKEITVTPQINVPVINGPDAVCQNSTDNTYSVAGYPAGTIYKWQAIGGLTITSADNAATVTVSAGAIGGTLTLAVSNTCFVPTVATKVVTIKPLPAAPATVTGEAIVCAGTQQTYTAASVPGASYFWDLPTGWSVVPGTPTSEREITVIVGNSSGAIAVFGSNECGISEQSASIAVTVNDKPALPTISGETTACKGTELTYSIAKVDDAIKYNWTVPATWTLVSGEDTNSITVRVGEGDGKVTVSVENGCGASATAELVVAPTPAPANPIITGDAQVCENTQGVVYTVTNPEGGVTYTWTLPQGWSFANGINTGASITAIASTTGGNVQVQASNACSDVVMGQPFAVTVFAPPVTPGQIADNSNACDGLTYSINPVQGATSYNWTVTSGFTIVSGQGTTTITVTADNTTQTGTVSVSAVNGPCSSVEASAPIDASLADGNLDFPKAFSPNGDNINDTWEIKNLEKFPVNEVIIFNRWGSEVYKTKGYQNNWTGNGLEQGTYFYKVRVTVCDGVEKEFTGYVTLFR